MKDNWIITKIIWCWKDTLWCYLMAFVFAWMGLLRWLVQQLSHKKDDLKRNFYSRSKAKSIGTMGCIVFPELQLHIVCKVHNVFCPEGDAKGHKVTWNKLAIISYESMKGCLSEVRYIKFDDGLLFPSSYIVIFITKYIFKYHITCNWFVKQNKEVNQKKLSTWDQLQVRGERGECLICVTFMREPTLQGG